MRRPALLLAGIAVVAGPLAGCSSTVQADPAADARTLSDAVKRQTGVDARNVVCPAVEGEVGTTFDCTFDGPDGAYVGHMTIVSVDPPRVDYEVKTERVR